MDLLVNSGVSGTVVLVVSLLRRVKIQRRDSLLTDDSSKADITLAELEKGQTGSSTLFFLLADRSKEVVSLSLRLHCSLSAYMGT